MKNVNPIQLLDISEMEKLAFVNINGTVYFGNVTITSEDFVVKDAIVVDGDPNMTEIVKKWAKAMNNGELRNPVVGGNIAYNKEDLNESQQMELSQVVTTINFRLRRGLTDIANGIIDEVV